MLAPCNYYLTSPRHIEQVDRDRCVIFYHQQPCPAVHAKEGCTTAISVERKGGGEGATNAATSCQEG